MKLYPQQRKNLVQKSDDLKIKDLLLSYPAKLSKISETPELEIELLLSKTLGKEREFFIKNPDYKLTGNELKTFERFFSRRKKYEPISYVLGEKEFYGFKFFVNKDVLIPRPETEILVEKVIGLFGRIQDHRPKKIIKIYELATGSGAIIISIAKTLKDRKIENVEFEASDISDKALKVAKKNAEEILGKDHKIIFKKRDILSIKKLEGNIFSTILISNPPYIPTKNIKGLDKDVKNFEPRIALDGGKDGMKFYKKIFEIMADSEIKVGFFELESKNANDTARLAKTFLPRANTQILKDYNGKNRILKLF